MDSKTTNLKYLNWMFCYCQFWKNININVSICLPGGAATCSEGFVYFFLTVPPGRLAVLQLPCCPSKQKELLENILQNLRNKWPPQPVVQVGNTDCRSYIDGDRKAMSGNIWQYQACAVGACNCHRPSVLAGHYAVHFGYHVISVIMWHYVCNLNLVIKITSIISLL